MCACVHTFPYDALTKRIQIEIYKFNGIWGADCAPLFALQHNTTHREMRKKIIFCVYETQNLYDGIYVSIHGLFGK